MEIKLKKGYKGDPPGAEREGTLDDIVGMDEAVVERSCAFKGWFNCVKAVKEKGKTASHLMEEYCINCIHWRPNGHQI